jgi:hypothetical protein
MSRIMLLLAAGGLLASAGVHLATFVPGLPISMGQVGFLHVVLFVPFVAMILKARAIPSPGAPRAEAQRALLRLVPARVKVAAVALFAYAILNFALATSQLGGARPQERDGRYFRAHGGQAAEEISAEEHARLQHLELRAFSGHWLLFYGLPTIFFGWVEPGSRAGGGKTDGRGRRMLRGDLPGAGGG